jgi:hypothetical protein
MPEKIDTIQQLANLVGKTGTFLEEYGAIIYNKKIVIERNKDGYLQVTVTIITS